MASLAEFLQAQKQFYDQPQALDYAQGIYNAAAAPMGYRLKQLEERKAFEDYANTQKLRELFAQSKGMPDIASVGQYSPEMAIKLQQAQLENLAKQAAIQESGIRSRKGMQDIQAGKGQAFANAIGPHADQYFQDVQMGMPQGQALNKFKMMTGQSLNMLQQQGMTPDVPFDMNTLTPEAALRAASGHGYKSMHLQQQYEQGAEQFKRGLPPAPTAEQYYGGTHMTPQGPMRTPPVVGGGQSPFQVMDAGTEGMEPAPMGQQDVDNLRMMYQQTPPGPDKDRLGGMLADAIKQTLPGRGGFVTPGQAEEMRIEEKAKETTAREEAKAEVSQAEMRKQKAEILSSLPKIPELNKLIDQSMSGKVEEMVKGKVMGELGGIPSQALDATKQLNIVASQMKQITKSLVGVGAVSDFEQRMMADAAGNIADPGTPAETRKKQLQMFNRIIRKTLEKSPKLAQELNQPEEAPVEQSTSGKPKIGEVQDGYVFKGGNPADPNSWEKQ